MAMPFTAQTSDSLPNIEPPITSQWRRFDELSPRTLYEVLRLRQAIFVVEQGSPYPDLDGLDQRARHLLLCDGGDALCGYLRLLPPAEGKSEVRVGRVCVARNWRKQGLGRRLMAEGLRFCWENYPRQPVVLGAQLYLVSFYESFGFTVAGEPYDDFGIPHSEMRMPG
jgi:ElaA protein